MAVAAQDKKRGNPMNKIISSAILAMAFTSTATAGTYINSHSNECDQILDKSYYQICYDYKAKGAHIVEYTLDGDKVNSRNIKKRPRFYPDKSIPRQYRTKSSDYTHNEFHADRGHLAPDASFDWSKKSLHSVYSMANIIPQYKWINRKSWVKAEKYERLVATRLGQVQVINIVKYGDYRQRLRKSGIAYPVSYIKMLRNEDKGFKRCFKYKNDAKAYRKDDKLRDHEVDCGNVR